MSCRWDRDQETYLADGEPCKRDEYGDATRHCTARRTCANHIGYGELTCARCLGRCRMHVRHLVSLAAEMYVEALVSGKLASDAVMYAGPPADMGAYAANREALSHRILAWERLGRISGRQYGRELADLVADDESHPANVLGVWCRMWAEDYGLEPPDTRNLSACVRFVEGHLNRVAQDEHQDFPLFAREVRACRNGMERALRDTADVERGAPCPDCTTPDAGLGPRLVREYGHWCLDPLCEKFNHIDDDDDRWVCPRDDRHTWTHTQYVNYIEERQAGRGA